MDLSCQASVKMSVLEHSQRFLRLVESSEGSAEQILEIMKRDLLEIEELCGLNRQQLEALIIDLDTSVINEDNYARVFDMLDFYAFGEMNDIVRKVCRDSRMKSRVYDPEQLSISNEIKELVEGYSCICVPVGQKCQTDEEAAKREHYFCFRMSFIEAAKQILGNGHRMLAARMVELELVRLIDLIPTDMEFVYQLDDELVYDYLSDHPERIDLIKKYVRLIPDKGIASISKRIHMLKILAASGETLESIDISEMQGYYNRHGDDPMTYRPQHGDRQWLDDYIESKREKPLYAYKG